MIFKQAGATLTAQYRNSSITQNTTIPAGSYQMAGSFTVPSGVTLTISPSATLNFPSSASLSINGALVCQGTSGNRVTMTRSGVSPWTGINLTSANGSKVTSTSTFTMTNDSIVSASFSNAALQFYGSNPTVSNVVIIGQSGSSNGVRFAAQSGTPSNGSIVSSTIKNLGAGNGIVVEGGSSPVVQSNTIRDNKYHGIIMNYNGSGSPTIVQNSFVDNGVVGGVKTYTGMNFKNSTGKIGSNTVQGSNYGIYFDTYSSPTTYWTGSYSGLTGNNTLTGNLGGLVAYYYSNPSFGRVESLHGEPVYYGTCNNILSNTSSNAFANTYCSVDASGNYWGADPPDPNKIVAVNGSNIAYGYWGTPSQPCPGGGPASANPIGTPELVVSGISSMEQTDAVMARIKGDYASARDQYLAILESESTDKERALVGLYEVFRDSKDQLTFDGIKSFTDDPELGSLATDLVMNAYLVQGDLGNASKAAQRASLSDDPETALNALILLASLQSYSDEYSGVSEQAREDLQKSNTVDEGLLVALGIEPVSRVVSERSGAESEEEFTISNYPNPFNPSTTISFTIPSDGRVRLQIYDMLGRVVERLLDEERTAGNHRVTFEGSQLPSGVYFYRLEFAGKILSRKFVLAK